MKRKNIFLHIATIALCVCAIVVGVYSAKTATLNVGGSIGFKAYGADVDVNVYMYGHATAPKGTPVSSDVLSRTNLTSSGAIQVRGEDVNKSSLFSTVYFTDANSSSDKPQDIVVVFEFTNKSKFDVLASLDIDASTCPDNITIKSSGTVSLDEVGGTNTTGTMSVSLSLNDVDGTYTGFSVQNLAISIKVEKMGYKNVGLVKKFADDYVPAGSEAIEGCMSEINEITGTTSRTYVEAFPYYIEMGALEETTFKWLVVGKLDSSGTVVALEDGDIAALEAGAMINGTDYVVLSEGILGCAELPFLESSNFTTSDGTSTNTTYGTNANEYATSYIRTILKSDEMLAFFTEEEQALIKERSIQSMYSTDTTTVVTDMSSGSETVTTNENGLTFPSNVSGCTEIDTSADKFWLLSETEMRTIFAEDACMLISAGMDMMAYPTAMIADSSGSDIGMWWLRSPAAGSTNEARVAFLYSAYSEVDDNVGLRPAFII